MVEEAPEVVRMALPQAVIQGQACLQTLEIPVAAQYQIAIDEAAERWVFQGLAPPFSVGQNLE